LENYNSCIMKLKQHIGQSANIRYINGLGYENDQRAKIVYVGKEHVVIRASDRDIPIKRGNIRSVSIETT
jgi:hypothetical protein